MEVSKHTTNKDLLEVIDKLQEVRKNTKADRLYVNSEGKESEYKESEFVSSKDKLQFLIDIKEIIKKC